MTTGLVKERITYFHKNGKAYQCFDTIFGTSKVMVYVNIDNHYALARDFIIDHKIANEEELKSIAVENEFLWEVSHG